MRWPWNRCPEPDHDGLARARAQLAKARADEPRIADLADTIHHELRKNHFGPRFAAALREEKRS